MSHPLSPQTGIPTSSVDRFNHLSVAQQQEALLAVCSSDAWVHGMIEGLPFPNEEAALSLADGVLATLTEPELDAAIDGHPRIGDRTDNPSSVREQAGLDHADASVRAELAMANQAYEKKFGQVYLVCASGRSAAELLELLTERLTNDPSTERAIMRAELGKINRLRLHRLLCEA